MIQICLAQYTRIKLDKCKHFVSNGNYFMAILFSFSMFCLATFFQFNVLFLVLNFHCSVFLLLFFVAVLCFLLRFYVLFLCSPQALLNLCKKSKPWYMQPIIHICYKRSTTDVTSVFLILTVGKRNVCMRKVFFQNI